jgi:glycosyltransferase involved in cell wall biosynthesis
VRVLTVVEDLGPGGTQRNAQNFAAAYRERGHDSAVLTLRGGGPRERDLGEAGVAVFLGSEDGLSQASRWRPDLLHIHRPGFAWPETDAVVRVLKERSRHRLGVIETNVFARADPSPGGQSYDVHGQLTRWCLWKWQRWSRRIRPEPLGVVLPYMADERAFFPAPAPERPAFRREHGIPEGAVVFGRVGSPLMGKWSPVVFDAFAALAAEREDVWLAVAGLPPELRARVGALPAPVRARVVELPFMIGDAALRRCYSALDVFLHAAHIGESFGMVLCEALLCGLPVITLSRPSKDNSQVEVVGHERGGLVVNGRASMVEAMRRLADDAVLRARYAAQGAQWVREQYGREPVGALLEALALAVAEAPSRQALRRRLEGDPRFVLRVDDREVRRVLFRGLGRPSRVELALLRLVSQPRVYSMWLRARRIRGSL